MTRPILHSLQSLRGIAALLVVMSHATYWSKKLFDYKFLSGAFKFGLAGVDIFFVLSGFIIYYVHHEDLGRREKLGPYLTRRFIRIIPFYWLFLFGSVFYYLLFPQYGHGYETDITYIARALVLWPGWSIVPLSWTLSYEVHFYILFAFAIALNNKWRRLLLFAWTALIVTRYLSFAFGPESIIRAFNTFPLRYISHYYNIEFVLGCLIGWHVIHYPVRHRKFILTSGVVLFLGYGILMNLALLPTRPFSIFLFGSASALIVAGLASFDLAAKINPPKFLVWSGDASYSIYLTHWRLIHFFLKMALKLGLVELFGLFPVVMISTFVTIGIGFGVYHLVEKPMLLYLRNKFSPKKL